MKKFGIVIATVIVMALTGCGSKEKTTTADKVAVEVSTEATTEITTEETTEEVVEDTKTTEEKSEESEKNEKSEKTTESVAQTTGVQQTTEAPKPAQSTQQTSTPVPTTTEAPKPATTQAPVTTEAPAPVHQHTWATRTETVTEAWTETVEHPAVTHKERHNKCNYCDEFYYDIFAHQDQVLAQGDTKHAIAGYSTATQIIEDQEAWTEIVEHPAVTKDVTYCTECGATK